MADNCAADGQGRDDKVAAEHEAASVQPDPLDLLLQQKKKLEQLNGWFDIALNNMVRGLSMFDAAQRLIVCNTSYREMYELPDELTRPGTPLRDIVRFHVKRETGRDGSQETTNLEKWIAAHTARLATGHSFSHVQSLRDGRKLLVTYQPLADGGWVDIQEDITEKRRAEERIEWLARHDVLTSIANRFHFRETFENALKDQRAGQSLALHWLDLDRFKEVNDTLGHPVGDALLKAVADRLCQSVRKNDFLARLGGDEFAIIQTGVRDPEQCERLARRVLHDIAKPYSILGHSISINASIGIVRAPENGEAADELLKKADVALYNVKQGGRRGYAMFGSSCGGEANVETGLEAEIKAALANEQLELHYQPQFNLRTQQVTCCEALIRWRHPRLGLLAPADFLETAERTGAIMDIGRWVLNKACRQAKRWDDGMKVAVNLSSLQIESGELLAVVGQALKETLLKPTMLKLEVGEAILTRHESATRKTLDGLRKLGIGIALDDFGRNNGSLSLLQDYPFDEIKIDRALVKDVPLRADSAAIVRAVASLAQTLGIRSVAEGVETLDELTMVARAGCYKVQGYYISRPVPAGELGPVLTECPLRVGIAA